MAPKLLVFGRIGQVGGSLLSHLPGLGELVAPSLEEADFTRPEKLAAVVADVRPAIIVNAAAYTAVDKAETERDQAFLINCEAPRVLARAAAQLDALLIHYSTDYVFPGDRAADAPGYREIDGTGPLSVYGKSKLGGETAIADAGCKHLIFRTAWLYNAEGANFVNTMRRLSRERETLRVVADQVGTPTWARDVAEVTVSVMKRYLQQQGEMLPVQLGVFHLTSGGRTNWHAFASEIIAAERERHGGVVTKSLEAIATREYPTPAIRPAFSVLDNGRLRNAYGIALENWKDRFQAFLASEDESQGH